MRLAVLLLLPLAACTAQPAANAVENAAGNAAVDLPAPANTIAARDPVADQTIGTLHICDFDGWSADKDPAGLNVRAEPAITARIVRTLPAPIHDAENDRDEAPGFDVFEARGGWFLIGTLMGTGNRRETWGWVHGSKITFALQTDIAFTEPTPASPRAVTVWQDRDGVHAIDYGPPLDCKGHWVQLSVSGRDRRPRIAWARGICANQETTCDGGVHDVHGDMLRIEDMPSE